MSVEVRPLGVKCNIACHYCYQNSLRSSAGNRQEYDLELVKQAILKKGKAFTLFGGEPLLLPKADLEELFTLGYNHFGQNAIQTNGVLIDADHVSLFKKFRVSVGISIDGPGLCNSPRWAGSNVATLKSTEKVENALELLLSEGIAPGIITTLHAANASTERLPLLLDWFVALDLEGIRSARIHLLETDSDQVARSLSLSDSENLSALISLDRLERNRLKNLRFDIFREIEMMLAGSDAEASCIWRACDPYTTSAVQGVEGHGAVSNCGRTNKAGVDFVKADRPGFERYLALYYTETRFGGCKDCRFFLFCKGQCPGTGIDGDWRNRSNQCEVWFKLFEHIESRLQSEGKIPLSLREDRVMLEQHMIQNWVSGRNSSFSQFVG